MPGVGFSVSGPTGNSTFTTNASGLKHMIGIPFGTYTFTETVPKQYRLTSHANPFNVVVDKTSITYVFVGNQPLGKLRLKKYEDTNGNGAQDAGEQTMPGVQFHITGPEGYDITKNTNSAGLIKLFNLVPGTYTVTETVPGGYTIVGANPRIITINPTNLTYLNIGNLPNVVEPEGSPDPTPTPTPSPSTEPTVEPGGSPDPESTPTPDPTLDPLGSLDPSDDPGAGGLGDPDDPAVTAADDPGVAPISFADTGAMQAALPGLLLMLAGLYTFRRWQQA
ncbi:MAG: SpaA isopeptide-forming pilin-related protein [Patescibacteria group bacterium]